MSKILDDEWVEKVSCRPDETLETLFRVFSFPPGRITLSTRTLGLDIHAYYSRKDDLQLVTVRRIISSTRLFSILDRVERRHSFYSTEEQCYRDREAVKGRNEFSVYQEKLSLPLCVNSSSTESPRWQGDFVLFTRMCVMECLLWSLNF